MTQARNNNDELLLRRYLLGGLAMEEQRALEQQLMTDQDLFSRLIRAEEELLDAYVRGEIFGAEKEAFEGRFLKNPKRWQDLQFARVLKHCLTKFMSS